MSILTFEKREGDWWFFTLLPLYLLLGVLFFNFIIGKLNINNFILVLSQQLLFLSIVQFVTDLGSKAKGKRKNIQIGGPIYLIIFGLLSLATIYAIEKELLYSIISLIVATIVNFIAIKNLNKNPYSSPYGGVAAKEFTKGKQKSEQKKTKEFKSKLKTNKYQDIKFGDKNE